jgi:hypothetical protein
MAGRYLRHHSDINHQTLINLQVGEDASHKVPQQWRHEGQLRTNGSVLNGSAYLTQVGISGYRWAEHWHGILSDDLSCADLTLSHLAGAIAEAARPTSHMTGKLGRNFPLLRGVPGFAKGNYEYRLTLEPRMLPHCYRFTERVVRTRGTVEDLLYDGSVIGTMMV